MPRLQELRQDADGVEVKLDGGVYHLREGESIDVSGLTVVVRGRELVIAPRQTGWGPWLAGYGALALTAAALNALFACAAKALGAQ
jgi:hypothetical protein